MSAREKPRPRCPRRSGTAPRGTARTRFPPARHLSAEGGPDRDRVGELKRPGGAGNARGTFAQSLSTAEPAPARASSARPAPRDRASAPYGDHQKKCDKREKDKAQIVADGEKLQCVQTLGQQGNAAR